MTKTQNCVHCSVGLRVIFTLGTILAGTHWGNAQTQGSPSSIAPNNVAALYGAESADSHSASTAPKASPVPASPEPVIPAAIAQRLEAMQAEIEALKAELRSRDNNLSTPAIVTVQPPMPTATPEPKPVEASAAKPVNEAAQTSSGLPEKAKPAEPFAYADWTWLNGTPATRT